MPAERITAARTEPGFSTAPFRSRIIWKDADRPEAVGILETYRRGNFSSRCHEPPAHGYQ